MLSVFSSPANCRLKFHFLPLTEDHRLDDQDFPGNETRSSDRFIGASPARRCVFVTRFSGDIPSLC